MGKTSLIRMAVRGLARESRQQLIESKAPLEHLALPVVLRLPDVVKAMLFLDANAWDREWEWLVELVAGRLKDPLPLLELLAEEKPSSRSRPGDDLFRHRLCLAVRCLGQVRELAGASEIIHNDRQTLHKTARELCQRIFKLPLGREVLKLEPQDQPSFIRACLPIVARFYSEGVVCVLECLRDPEKYVPSSATVALGAMGEAVARHPEVLPRLAEWLRDRHWIVRSRAAEALGAIGEAAARHPEVLPRLVEYLREPDKYVRFNALSALMKLMAHGYRVFRSSTGPGITVHSVNQLAKIL